MIGKCSSRAALRKESQEKKPGSGLALGGARIMAEAFNPEGSDVNAGVNWGHGAGVRRDHLLMPDTVLPVVPGVHWRDPRCFV